MYIYYQCVCIYIVYVYVCTLPMCCAEQLRAFEWEMDVGLGAPTPLNDSLDCLATHLTLIILIERLC